MRDYQYLGAELEQSPAETGAALKKRHQGLVCLGFALTGVAAIAAGLPDLLGYLLWATGVAAWMYVKTV